MNAAAVRGLYSVRFIIISNDLLRFYLSDSDCYTLYVYGVILCFIPYGDFGI